MRFSFDMSKNVFFENLNWTGGSASLWNSSMAEMGGRWLVQNLNLIKLPIRLLRSWAIGLRIGLHRSAGRAYNTLNNIERNGGLIDALHEKSGRRRWRSRSAATKGGKTEFDFVRDRLSTAGWSLSSVSSVNNQYPQIYAVSPKLISRFSLSVNKITQMSTRAWCVEIFYSGWLLVVL